MKIKLTPENQPLMQKVQILNYKGELAFEVERKHEDIDFNVNIKVESQNEEG